MYNGLEPDPNSDPLRLSEIVPPSRRRAGTIQAEEVTQLRERLRKQERESLPLFWFIPGFTEYQHKARRYASPILVAFMILRLRARGVRAGWYKSASDPNYIRAFEFGPNGNSWEIAVRFPRWMIEAECSFWDKRFRLIARFVKPK